MRTHAVVRRTTFFSVCLPVILALIVPANVRGQLLQGSITGNVTDTSSAAVPEARVAAKEQRTNFTRETTTNTAGEYSLPTMPPGTYTITVTAPSFQTVTVLGVSVSPEEVTRRDVTLAVSQLNQTVQVQAEAVGLQTDRADIRDDVTANLLENAPVPIGRNYQMLFLTLPGVSPPTNANSFTANASRGLTFVVNGGDAGYNSIRVDGAGTFDMTANAEAQFVPALEAIENVSMSGNSFSAEQTATGGAVNITVKSGTNNVHGALFEDHTNQHVQAYPWAADRTRPNPKYINNQYGGAIGGPIKKDKLFYFLSFEGTGLVQVAPFLAEVPTPAMRTGDLRASPTPIYDPLSGNANGTGRTPFDGNIIPGYRIDSGVRALLAMPQWSLPNQVGTGSLGLSNNLLTNGETYLRRAQTDAKINWNPTSKLDTFVRFGWGNNNWSTPEQFGILGGPNLSNTNTAGGTGGANILNGSVSGTYIFSSTLIFDAHFGYDVNIARSKQPAQNLNLGWTLMQIPGLSTAGAPSAQQLAQGGLPNLSIDGFAVLGSQSRFQPQDYYDPEKNVDVNLTWIRGSHSLRFGFDSDFQHSEELQYQAASGPYITGAGGFHFAQGTTQLNGGPAGNDYNAFASFLLGLPQDSGKIYQWPPRYYSDTKYFAGYALDEWHVTPKLTLNVGARLDYFPVPLRNGTGMEYYNSSNGTMTICGVAGVPTSCNIFDQYRLHLDPRIGIAYRFGNTVIRAGFGMSADPTNLFARSQARINFPYIEGLTLLPANSYSYATTLRQGIPTPTAPNVAAGSIPVPGTVGLYTYDRADYKRGYVRTYNFTIEQRIKSGWTLSAGYAGSERLDPMANLEQNWSPIGTGTAGQLLNNAANNNRTANTYLLGTMGSSNYNSLQVRNQVRFGGIAFSAGYTFSKNLGFLVPASNLGGAAMPWLYRTYDYGPLPTDITHNLETTALIELPFGKGKSWATSGKAAALLGGWQISDIFSAFTGRPFTAVASATSLNAVYSYQFANCVSTPQQTGNIYQWYNVSAFANPKAGGFGSCGEDALRGPGLINTDVGIERKFIFGEKLTFAFRVEAFNAANTPHHANPGATSSTGTTSANNISSSSFMQAFNIANTGRDGLDQRAVRLNLKLRW
ncbi:MAG TPA: carboxypeptidase regulatory-like domain-containing protein [Bryobacteraceae bacterium]|nr:carboxypeptidase regulatory-like domain-containing protein [Bryobacteraceae bacterium]